MCFAGILHLSTCGDFQKVHETRYVFHGRKSPTLFTCFRNQGSIIQLGEVPKRRADQLLELCLLTPTYIAT